VAAVRRLARDNDCSLVVVTQVRGDHQRSDVLATLLTANHLRWDEGRSHREQEAIVRACYVKSLAVVSDRIHALIIGLTEGAAPIGFTTGPAEKVTRTFAAVTGARVGFSQDEFAGPDLRAHLQLLVESRPAVLDDLRRARERLTHLASRLHASTNRDPAGSRAVTPSQNLERAS
jgi:hypothetical protein